MKRNILLLIFVCGLIAPTATQAQYQDPAVTTDKFEALFNHVATHYVDSVDGEDLVEEAIRAMLEKLDPHSIYIPADEVKAMNEPLKGNFDGIGVRFQILRDTIMVVNPIPGGPSEKLGIRAGDKIVTVEDSLVAGVGIKNADVMDKLRGRRGSKVNVGIYRQGEDELIPYTITRDKIPIHSIAATYMAAPKVGYVKLTRFAATSDREMKTALASLQDQGMKDLILDLRGNGGGYLRTAIRLCDEFLDENKLIVYTMGRNAQKEQTHTRSNQEGMFESGRLVVLIDESSASASEILAGAMQDWDRGLVIGRRSFGKGLVQKPINLPDGSAIRLTISRYYTPSGRCIQKPYDEGVDAYRKEKYDRRNSGELFSVDSIEFNDSLRFETQGGREVYGGGGIMPDIFIPLDTSYNSKYYRDLMRKGAFNTFALDYVDQNRDQLKEAYPDFGKYKAEFSTEGKLWDEFKAHAEDKGVEYDQEGYERAKEVVHTRLKAQIAANLWDNARFYEVINGLSDEYKRALEALEDNTFKKLKLAEAR